MTWLLVIALVGYVLVAEARRFPVLRALPGATTSVEVFPFFRWSLFSFVSRYGEVYRVEVLEADPSSTAASFEGRIVSDELPFTSEVRFQKAARRLFRYQKRGDAAATAQYRRAVEDYLSPHGIERYRIFRFRTDALADGRIVARETVTASLKIK